MAVQRSLDSLASSSAASYEGGWESTLQQRDALRKIALSFQAVVRVTRHVPLASSASSAERSSLCLAVAEYAALRRGRYAAPERVLISVKAVTSALSTGIDPITVDLLGRLVLQAFLAGYYGEAARTRSLANAADDVRLR